VEELESADYLERLFHLFNHIQDYKLCLEEVAVSLGLGLNKGGGKLLEWKSTAYLRRHWQGGKARHVNFRSRLWINFHNNG